MNEEDLSRTEELQANAYAALSDAIAAPDTSVTVVVFTVDEAAKAIRYIVGLCVLNGWDTGATEEYAIKDYQRTRITYQNGSVITVMLDSDPGVPKQAEHVHRLSPQSYTFKFVAPPSEWEKVIREIQQSPHVWQDVLDRSVYENLTWAETTTASPTSWGVNTTATSSSTPLWVEMTDAIGF